MSYQYEGTPLTRDQIKANVSAIDYASAPLDSHQLPSLEGIRQTTIIECDQMIDYANTLRELMLAGRIDMSVLTAANLAERSGRVCQLLMRWTGPKMAATMIGESTEEPSERGMQLGLAVDGLMAETDKKFNDARKALIPDVLNALADALTDKSGDESGDELGDVA